MTDKTGYSYTLTRTLDAPAATVWKAWTTPDQYAQWASAAPGSVEMDVRAGGTWKAVMVTPVGDIPLSGSYTEVVENRRLVLGMDVPGQDQERMSMDLEPNGDQTTIVLGQTCATEQERDMAEQGSTILLDGLAGYLASP